MNELKDAWKRRFEEQKEAFAAEHAEVERLRGAIRGLTRRAEKAEAEVERLRGIEGRYCALADHHDEAHEKCASKALAEEKA